ncbi:MAG: hypothetical protein HN742_04400 [Lentisphaerae bacterium]|jgi:hypothetical protein|nr:hypothetical protein [Lentisphaerota bacterium]MBT4823325.1 hypothetical protein [Lentisphaerota bacterium]MBT5605238.1 hypothetical protein [Lentisphaerota bacterium]MBT7054151.1 hypothetical protein [Lentisphaerota bacterium]MBT7841085.1 hypothetical protein [Lentisphaerota bacterium]
MTHHLRLIRVSVVALLALATNTARAFETVPVMNASFEETTGRTEGPTGPEWTRGGGPPGWHCWIGSIARTGNPKLVHDADLGRTGTHSVALSDCIGGVCVIQNVPVTAGETYVCTAWARTSNPRTTTKLSVRWQNADGKWTNNESSSDAVPSTIEPGAWHELSAPFEVPEGAAFAVILLTADAQKAGDTCWFDDVGIVHVGPEDLMVSPCGWLHTNCSPTDEPVQTPHVKWAKPWAGPRLKALFVLGNDHNLREHLEIAQRLDIEFDWVFAHNFDSALYGLHSKRVMDRLESRYYDVAVIATKAPASMVQGFAKRCRGLVLVGFRHPNVRAQPDGSTKTSWWSMLPSIPEGTELAAVSGMDFLAEALDAVPEVPLAGVSSVHGVKAGASPVKGGRICRVVFNTRFYCLTPIFGFDDHLRMGHGYWEAYQQLLIRAILWAGEAESPVKATCSAGANSATVTLASPIAVEGDLQTWVCDSIGVTLENSSAVRLAPDQELEVAVPVPANAASGPATVGIVLRDKAGKSLAFAITRIEVRRSPGITSVIPARPYFVDTPVAQAAITIRDAPPEHSLVARLTDARGRRHSEVRISSNGPLNTVVLPLTGRLSNFNWLDVALLDADGKQLDAARRYLLAPLPRKPFLDEFQIGTWACSSFMPQYLRPALHGLMKEAGITEGLQSRSGYLSMLAGDLWPISTAGRVPGFARWDNDETVRKPCLSDPKNRQTMADRARTSAGTDRGICPLFLYLQDETSLVKDPRDLDVCSCEHCVARFRIWLQKRYADLATLNGEWRTDYASWDDVGFAAYNDVRGTNTFAPWLMYRRFMDWTWAEGIQWAKQNAQQIDPELRVGMPNTFGPNPFSGRDYYQLAQVNDYRMEYARETRSTRGDGFYDVFRSFAPDVRDHPWVGYKFDDETIRFAPWWTAFHGATGFSVYGTMSLFAGKNSWAQIFPTLQHTPRGLLYADQARELKSGIGRILMEGKRTQAPIAILWSQPSMLVAWAISGQTGHPMSKGKKNAYGAHFASREAFRAAVIGSGRQFDYVAEEQIEKGALDKYSCLVLPAVYALGQGTVERVHRFLAGGGMVIADMGVGLTNNVGATYVAPGPVADLFGITRSGQVPLYEEGTLAVTLPPGKNEVTLKTLGRETVTLQPGTRIRSQADDLPTVTTKQHGKGKAIFLSFTTKDSSQLRALFSEARPVCEIVEKTTGETPLDHEAVRFDMGGNQYLGITHNPLLNNPDLDCAEIRLGRKIHVYDVRAAEYLGKIDRVETRIPAGGAAFYALLGYRVSTVEVHPSAGSTGGVHGATCELRTPEGPLGDHVVHVRVRRPDGTWHPAYERNVVAHTGSAVFSVPLALNDPVGKWTIVCRDVATGVEGHASFVHARSIP